MKVLRKSLRDGMIKLRVETLDDLWHLSNLVREGDLVRSVTHRRKQEGTDKVRPDRQPKVRMFLGVRVKEVEFAEFVDRLRVSGTIEEGPEALGQHHTFNFEPRNDMEVVKAWTKSDLNRIDEAVAATERPLGTFLAIDDEEAVIAQLRQYGLRELARIGIPRQGKMFKGKENPEDAYQEILEALQRADLGASLILLGPGFDRERFGDWAREREPELMARAVQHGTSQGGMNGISEALRSGAGAKVFEESRVGHETRLVERLLEGIAKDGPVAYGPAHVEAAVRAGAVETLLIADTCIRDAAVETLARETEKARGKAVIVSTRHEGGKKLEALGGLGALLRYKMG